jgi:hypothetical protein
VTLGRPSLGFDDHRHRRRVGRLLAVVVVAQLLGFVARGATKPADPMRVPLPAGATTTTTGPAVPVVPPR